MSTEETKSVQPEQPSKPLETVTIPKAEYDQLIRLKKACEDWYDQKMKWATRIHKRIKDGKANGDLLVSELNISRALHNDKEIVL